MKEDEERIRPSPARLALAENLAHLMAHYLAGFAVGIKAPELAKATGINARTIKRMLDPYSVHSTRLDSMDAVAGFFRVETWQLLRPLPKAIQLHATEATILPKQSKPRK